MKIRIKGASVRLRLSRSEVARLVHEGSVSEETPFGPTVFRYEARRVADGSMLSATFEDSMIRMLVPESLVSDWDTSELVSIDSMMQLEGGQHLYLLLEKDFQCLDQTGEDQSDNYINPNQIC